MTADLNTWLSEFWTNDTPSLGGIERVLIYGSLLAVCHFSYFARPPIGDSPLQAPELFATTDIDLFFEFRGMIEYFPRSYLQAMGYKGIDLIRRIVYVSWICCILGIFGHIPVIVTGVGIMFLEMIKISCTGVGHRMHLVVYLLFFLMLSNGRRTYSLDSYMFSHYPHIWSPFNPHSSGPIFYSGLSTKLALVASSFTLWVGATTKISNGGWRWLDGTTLAWQTISSPFGALPLMKRLFAIPAFAALSAIIAVVFEAGSFCIQFPQLKPWRLIWMLMCFKFHFVIYLTMNPNYFPQSLVYVPCVLTAADFISSGTGFANSRQTVVANFDQDPFSAMCIYGATSLFLCLAAVAIFRVEFWPLTCIPMYSYYRGDFLPAVKKASSNGIKAIESVGISSSQLAALAREHETINPRCIGWLDSWVDIRIVPRAGRTAAPVKQPTMPNNSKGARRGRSRSPSARKAAKTQPATAVHSCEEHAVSYSLREYIRCSRAQRSLYRLALSKVICQTISWMSKLSATHKIGPGVAATNSSSPAVQYLNLVASVLSRPTNALRKKEVEMHCAGSAGMGKVWDLALCYRGEGGGWMVAGKIPYE